MVFSLLSHHSTVSRCNCAAVFSPYFGGRRQCEEAAAAGARGEEAYNEADLVCGGCVLTEGGGNGCAKHGKEFIEYKCKWCCNIATWFCWYDQPTTQLIRIARIPLSHRLLSSGI